MLVFKNCPHLAFKSCFFCAHSVTGNWTNQLSVPTLCFLTTPFCLYCLFHLEGWHQFSRGPLSAKALFSNITSIINSMIYPEFPFAFLFFFSLLVFNWRLITLHYCIGFAIHQHKSATGIHVFPILNPPPSSLPIPPLWVISAHQPQASSIMHRTWIFIFTTFHYIGYMQFQKTKILAINPITSWQIDGGKEMETVADFILLGSKIITDGVHSCEIKRCLLLG